MFKVIVFCGFLSSSVAHYDFISCYNSQIAEATKAVSAEHSAVTSSAHLPVVLASDDRNNVLQNRETPAFSNEASTPLAAPLVTVQKEQSASFDLKPTTKAHKKEESPDVIEVGNSKELSASVVPSSNYNELPAAAVYYFKTSPQAIYLTKAPIPITIQKEPTGYKETLFSNTQLALKDEIPVTSVHSEEKKEDSALFERMPLDEYYAKPKYQFKYEIDDYHTGDKKSYQEKRDGDVTKGKYSVHHPHGAVLTVDYSVATVH